MLYLKRIQWKSAVCLALILGINAGAVAVAFAVGRWLDPYGLHHLPWEAPSPIKNAARVPLSSYSYVAKAAHIIRTKPAHILLGSSVVDDGFYVYGSSARWLDPDPRKTEEIFNAIDGDRSYLNAAVRGGGIREAREFLEHAYTNNPKLSHVVLGIEWSLLTHTGGPMIPTVNMLGKTHVPVGTYMEYTVSFSALQKAYEVLLEDHSPEDAPYREVALALRNIWSGIGRFAGETWDWMRAHAASAGADVLVPTSPSDKLFEGVKTLDLYRFVFTTWVMSSFKDRYDRGGLKFLMPDGSMEQFAKLAEFCRKKQIRTDVYLSPQHPIFWAFLRQFKLEHLVEHWISEIAAVTPAWDFSELMDFSDPDPLFETDTIHYHDKAGVIMLPILRKAKDGVPAGVVLATPDNARGLAARRERMLTDWLLAHADMKASIEALPIESIIRSEVARLVYWPDLLPTTYTPSYKGYMVVRFIGLYFAVPTEVPQPYNFHTFVQRKYPNMLNARSLEELLKNVDELHAK